MIPEINPSILADLFTVRENEGVLREESIERHQKHDLFVAAMALYLSTLHELVMRSWDQFKTETERAAEKKSRDEEVHEKREDAYKAAELQAEIRHYEVFRDNPGGKILEDFSVESSPI